MTLGIAKESASNLTEAVRKPRPSLSHLAGRSTPNRTQPTFFCNSASSVQKACTATSVLFKNVANQGAAHIQRHSSYTLAATHHRKTNFFQLRTLPTKGMELSDMRASNPKSEVGIQKYFCLGPFLAWNNMYLSFIIHKLNIFASQRISNWSQSYHTSEVTIIEDFIMHLISLLRKENP